MSIKKSILSNVVVTGSVLFILLVVASGLASAQMMNFPMRLDGTITGLTGSSCHVQIYNASGVTADFNSGATFSNVNIYGNAGDHITFVIDGRNAQVNGGSYISFVQAGYADVTLTYPAVQTVTPSPTNAPSGNTGSSGSGGTSRPTATPTATPAPSPSPTPTPTPTPTPMPASTVTPAPTAAPSGSGFSMAWLAILLVVIVVAIGAAYFYMRR